MSLVTKSDLEALNKALEEDRQSLLDSLSQYRKEFSKILGAPKKTEVRYGETKYHQEIYSWPEIFTEVGKLIERAKNNKEIHIAAPRDTDSTDFSDDCL